MYDLQERIEHLIARYDEELTFNLWRSQLARAKEIAWLEELARLEQPCV